jgi:hypothetical protein
MGNGRQTAKQPSAQGRRGKAERESGQEADKAGMTDQGSGRGVFSCAGAAGGGAVRGAEAAEVARGLTLKLVPKQSEGISCCCPGNPVRVSAKQPTPATKTTTASGGYRVADEADAPDILPAPADADDDAPAYAD